MREIIKLFCGAGTGVYLIAALTCVLTGIIKLPLKALAAKLSKCGTVTRFIVFLPLAISFALTVLHGKFSGTAMFSDMFYEVWLTAASGSLAIYAVWEKFVPTKKRILSEAELCENLAAIDKLNNAVRQSHESADGEPQSEQPKTTNKKIILTNKK